MIIIYIHYPPTRHPRLELYCSMRSYSQSRIEMWIPIVFWWCKRKIVLKTFIPKDSLCLEQSSMQIPTARQIIGSCYDQVKSCAGYNDGKQWLIWLAIALTPLTGLSPEQLGALSSLSLYTTALISLYRKCIVTWEIDRD